MAAANPRAEVAVCLHKLSQHAQRALDLLQILGVPHKLQENASAVELLELVMKERCDSKEQRQRATPQRRLLRVVPASDLLHAVQRV